MRFGPFPSAREGLKFGAYAAVGAALAAVLGVVWAVPVLGVGFVLSVVRPDGRGIDDQAAGFLAFCWRSRPRGAPPVGALATGSRPGSFVAKVPGHLIAIVAAEGIPIAFLPPAEARALFQAYRDFLRGLERGLVLLMGVVPLSERPLLPAPIPTRTGHPEEMARRGYSEMVRLLCQRRYRRRVLVGIWEPDGLDAALRLERNLDRLEEGLARLGVRGERLRDRALRSAAVQIGWNLRSGA